MEEASLGTKTAEQRRRRMKQRVEREAGCRRSGGSGSFSSTTAQAAAALDARRTRELKIAPRARACCTESRSQLLRRIPSSRRSLRSSSSPRAGLPFPPSLVLLIAAGRRAANIKVGEGKRSVFLRAGKRGRSAPKPDTNEQN